MTPQRYEFGNFVLSIDRGLLLRSGVEVPLRPKSFQVLHYLIEHRGEIVTREQLLDAVWGSVVVTEGSVTKCLIDVRRALGDEEQRIIRTLPKRGYLFDPAQAPPALAAPVSAARSKRTWVFAGCALLTIASVAAWVLTSLSSPTVSTVNTPAHSIAVLPFVDMSAGKDQAYLADGIAEEILNRLAQSSKLRVIARTSSFSFRDQSTDIASIADQLGVSHVLEGSIRRSGDAVRITAQLIAAADSAHVWSETYDRKIDDLFAVQDQLAASISTALEVTLQGNTPHRGMPSSVAAYESFLRGSFLYARHGTADLEQSVDHFKNATAIDPGYARAWAALAGAYDELAWEEDPPSKALQRLQFEAANKAVTLDPGLAVAHSRLAFYFYNATDDWEQAEFHTRKATAIDPNEPSVLSMRIDDLIVRDDFMTAIADARRMVAQDPLSAQCRTKLAMVLLRHGDLAEAVAESRKVLELNPDAGPDIEVQIARALVLQSRIEDAIEAAEILPTGNYRDFAQSLFNKVPARAAAADSALQRIAAHDAATPNAPIRESVRLADALAWRGRYDEAFAVLEHKAATLRGVPQERILVWYLQQQVRLSPFLQPMHDDPRWQMFLAVRRAPLTPSRSS